MQDFYYQQSLLDLEPRPELLDTVACDEHGMFFVEFLVRKYSLSIYHDQPFLPLAQYLGLLEDLAIVVAVLDQGLRNPWDVGQGAFV